VIIARDPILLKSYGTIRKAILNRGSTVGVVASVLLETIVTAIYGNLCSTKPTEKQGKIEVAPQKPTYTYIHE